MGWVASGVVYRGWREQQQKVQRTLPNCIFIPGSIGQHRRVAGISSSHSFISFHRHRYSPSLVHTQHQQQQRGYEVIAVLVESECCFDDRRDDPRLHTHRSREQRARAERRDEREAARVEVELRAAP